MSTTKKTTTTTTKKPTKKRARRRRMTSAAVAARYAAFEARDAREEAREERRVASQEGRDLQIRSTLARITDVVEGYMATAREQLIAQERRAEEQHAASIEMMKNAPSHLFVPRQGPTRPRGPRLAPVPAPTGDA